MWVWSRAAVLLAEMGRKVTCVDVDAIKVGRLKEGIIPIFEPGLAPWCRPTTRPVACTSPRTWPRVELPPAHLHRGRHPPDEDGSADLQHVLAVAGTIGRLMETGKVVVNKSTVPVGTATRVRRHIESHPARSAASRCRSRWSQPRGFLKEGRRQ